MTTIELEIHDNAVEAINKIKGVKDTEVELYIPEKSVLFDNIINLKLIQNYSENLGIDVVFNTDDEKGDSLIESMSNNISKQTGGVIEDAALEEAVPKKTERKLVSVPKIALPKIKIPKAGLLVMIGAVAVVIYFLLGHFSNNIRKAEITIIVNSQELTRSLTLKIKSDSDTNLSEKIIKGETIEASIEEFAEIETTGEKIIGDYAKGEVKIYNNTDDDKNINKGTPLKFKNLTYEIVESVELPAYKFIGTNPQGNLIFEPGEAEAKVRAEKFGPDYNIDKDEDLDVDDYDDSDIYAKTSSDIDGGRYETLQVVSQKDVDDLKTKISEQSKEPLQAAMQRKIPEGKKLIKGSESVTIAKETLSHKPDEETDKLTLTQTINGVALTYNENDINSTIDDLIKDLVPEGFELSDKEKEISVEVLGNTTDSVLSTNEADIQVSVRTFVVAIIDKETLKERLKNKTLDEAQGILRNIQNIQNFSINITPNIKLLDKLPKDADNIEITLERQ